MAFCCVHTRFQPQSMADGRVRPQHRRSLPLRELLAAVLVGVPAEAVVCPPAEPVSAFYAGQVDLGAGPAECSPEMEACYFPGKVFEGPDEAGNYMIDWDDGDTANRHVHHTKVRKIASGQPCSGPEVVLDDDEDENWVPPEIPCTILPRLHWEGSDPDWNKEAIASLKKEYRPDEVIDGFDWHVILRFHDVDKCEACFNSLSDVLKKCKQADPEKCHSHAYVKAIEYVGDDPQTRRKSGRQTFVPKASRKEEL